MAVRRRVEVRGPAAAAHCAKACSGRANLQDPPSRCARAMDGALVVALWLACSLAAVGISLARTPVAAQPPWLVPTSVLLGPIGIIVLVAWTVSHRPRPSAP